MLQPLGQICCHRIKSVAQSDAKLLNKTSCVKATTQHHFINMQLVGKLEQGDIDI